MSGDASVSLAGLLSQTHLDDHEEILKAANDRLAKSSNDVYAQHVRAVALLKLDRISDSLGQMEQGGDRLKGQAPLEYAYALYKTGKLADAERVAAEIASSKANRGALHVLAQTTYRSEDFARASDVYRDMAARVPDGDCPEHSNDLRINRLAVDAQALWQDQSCRSQRAMLEPDDPAVFETTYNAACCSIACGAFEQGEVLLKRAQDLCLTSEDLTDDEKNAEIQSILTQQIHVLHELGRADEAERLAEEVLAQDIPDVTTSRIARINTMLRPVEGNNPYLRWRSLQELAKFPASDKLFAFQSNIVDYNDHIMSLACNKHKGAASVTLKTIAAQPSASTSPATTTLSVIYAAAHAKGTRGKAAIKELLPLNSTRPHDVGLALTIVQVYLQDCNYGAATAFLEGFLANLEKSDNPNILATRFAPGLVGTLAALYANTGRRSSVRRELSRAADYWLSTKAQSGNPPPASLLHAAGAALLESSRLDDLEQAGKIFAVLLQMDSSDRGAATGLVASYASTHPEMMEAAQLDALTPLVDLVSDVDVDALERAGVATSVVAQQEQQASSAKRSADKERQAHAAKRQRLRKSRLPPNYDPDKKMDPERWLPMRDRSYYKPKGRRARLRQAGLTQGGVAVEEKQGGSLGAQPAAAAGARGANKKRKGKK